MTLDTRIGVLLLWGGGTVLVFLVVFLNRWRRYRRHKRDRRKAVRMEVRRDVLSGFALFLVALCSAAATAMVLFGSLASGPRGLLVAIALGAFTGAGLVMASEEDADGEREADTGGSYDLPQTYDSAGDH